MQLFVSLQIAKHFFIAKSASESPSEGTNRDESPIPGSRNKSFRGIIEDDNERTNARQSNTFLLQFFFVREALFSLLLGVCFCNISIPFFVDTMRPLQIGKKELLDRLLRVDQAGEYGARRIYEGSRRFLFDSHAYEQGKKKKTIRTTCCS
jgi:hypothetical protein